MRRLVVLTLCALALPAASAQAWSWPVSGTVLRPFAFDPADPYASGQHRGIDIGAEEGSAVVAPADGKVSFAGTVPGGGKTVSIVTPLGYTATLLHLGSIAVKRDSPVVEGITTLGTVGAADETQPYVYFGIRVTSEPQGYVDPTTLLPARPVADPVPATPATATSAPATDEAPSVAPPTSPPASAEVRPTSDSVAAVSAAPGAEQASALVAASDPATGADPATGSSPAPVVGFAVTARAGSARAAFRGADVSPAGTAGVAGAVAGEAE